MAGGKREGAGRKPKTGQPMVVKRIPVSLVPAIDDLIGQMTKTPNIQCSDVIPLDAFRLPETLSILSVPLALESVPAGFPSPAEPYIEDYLDFNEYLVKNKPATIAVRCGGESMRDAGINKNDLLVIDRSRVPKHQDIVMADLGNEYTIKRLHIEGKRVSLRSENTSEEYPNFTFENGETLTVVGVVAHVIKSY